MDIKSNNKYPNARYTYCQKCFNEIQGDTVTLGDDPAQPSA